jgi:hypothetical protein
MGCGHTFKTRNIHFCLIFCFAICLLFAFCLINATPLAVFKEPRVMGKQSLTLKKRGLTEQELVRLEAHNQLPIEPL